MVHAELMIFYGLPAFLHVKNTLDTKVLNLHHLLSLDSGPLHGHLHGPVARGGGRHRRQHLQAVQARPAQTSGSGMKYHAHIANLVSVAPK